MNFLLVALLSLSSIASAQTWNSANDPALMDPNYVYNLNELPTSGTLTQKPWSETYWPNNQGSINFRWNDPSQQGFGTDSPSRDDVMSMSRAALEMLAPSEKYDIYMGHYDYPLKQEVSGIADTRAPWWTGICDGWTIAATQYAEPQPVDAINPDGVIVPFGSSDIKALMSYAAAAHFSVKTAQVGLRCTGTIFASGCGKNDPNPGALHVILANELGIKGQAFVMDRDPSKQIWNQPVYGYTFQYLGDAKTHTDGGGVQVHTTIYYTDELDKSLWQPVTATPQFKSNTLEMDYILDLDGNGNIVGGSMTGSDHPDFVWKAVNQLTFTDIMFGVNNLYVPVPATGMPTTASVPVIPAATPVPPVPTAIL